MKTCSVDESESNFLFSHFVPAVAMVCDIFSTHEVMR